MHDIKRAERLSQAVVHFVTARVSLFTDRGMPRQPIRAKCKHCKTICEHTFDNSPTDSSSSCLKWLMIVQDMVWNLFIRQLAISLHTFLRMTFHVTGPSDCFRVRFLPTRYFLSSNKLRDSNIFLYSSRMFSFDLHSHVEYIPNAHGQEMKLVPQDQRFSSISSTKEPCSASFQPIWCHPQNQTEITLVSDERTYVSIYIQTFWLWNSEQFWSILLLLPITVWLSCNNIHYFLLQSFGTQMSPVQ